MDNFKMKKRAEGYLANECLDHDSEVFDYIRELHEVLWILVDKYGSRVSSDLDRNIEALVKAPKNELQPLNAREVLDAIHDADDQSRDENHCILTNGQLVHIICSKFGSSGKRPLDREALSKIMSPYSIMNIYDESGYLDLLDEICKEFSTAEVSLPSLEQTIINNGFNGGITTGDGPILVQPKQLAKAIKRELEGK